MCDRYRTAGTGLAAFLLGAIVGAAAGLLLAPAKGETTRRRLKRWANDTYEDNKELM
ncbi:MAG: YtxH domain-containing protein, partial [Elusimicrobiaceae bacterium]|nr:YtxH domain-containing protein [Elusimicrobiaceae bacterium]